MINHAFISFSAVQIHLYGLLYSFVFFIIYGYIMNSHCDQLPDSFIAQLVVHCTVIAEVMGSTPVQGWFFFGSFFRCCLCCAQNWITCMHVICTKLLNYVLHYLRFVAYENCFPVFTHFLSGGRRSARRRSGCVTVHYKMNFKSARITVITSFHTT